MKISPGFIGDTVHCETLWQRVLKCSCNAFYISQGTCEVNKMYTCANIWRQFWHITFFYKAFKCFWVLSDFVKKAFFKNISISDTGILPLVQILKLGNSKSSRICNFILQRHIGDNRGCGLAVSNGFSDRGDLLQRRYKHWLRTIRVNIYQNYYQLSNNTDVMVFSMIEKLPVKLSQKG